ncbi:MAG: DNA-binding MarR family transcriptional regulator [Sulfurimonas sp.]|jgi:DNA-binding MarR family transcriptional regulator
MVDILTQMLKYSKEYSDINKDESVEAFIDWLCHKNKLQNPSKKVSNTSLIFEIHRTNTKIKSITKDILKSCNLNSLDDYYYLIELKQHKSLSKSVLINSFNHEISKGSEIIKRLINVKLLIQTTDTKDKRVKLIKLTPQALTILSILENKLSDVYTKSLTPFHEEEKETIVKLLKKIK